MWSAGCSHSLHVLHSRQCQTKRLTKSACRFMHFPWTTTLHLVHWSESFVSVTFATRFMQTWHFFVSLSIAAAELMWFREEGFTVACIVGC